MFKDSSAKYYQYSKERLPKKRYWEQYKNITEDEKQKLVEYRKKIL